MRNPAELAREVRDALLFWMPLNGEPRTAALAALAELEAQAEAGQRVIAAAQTLYDEWHGGDPRYPEEDDLRDALAAAAPSPADQEEWQYTEEPSAGKHLPGIGEPSA